MGTSKKSAGPSVDEYINSLPSSIKSVLGRLRKAIKEAAPNAVELISYRIPTYKYKGPLVHFAAFKDHCSFIVVNKAVIDEFKDELVGFDISGTTIHFRPGKPIPDRLVKKMVKMRVKQNGS